MSSLLGPVFDEKKLMDLAQARSHEYQHADPFSHVVIDDFLSPEALERVLEYFPDPNGFAWTEYKAVTENGKLASQGYSQIPPYIRYVLDQLNTPPFLQFLETLTGIKKLIPDPYYAGGGMHQTKKGGWLSIHVDFNRYKELELYRHINVLVYLNKDWKEEYGGHLELWSKDMKQCVKKVAPVFNRCVIFTTSENSHHGHPDPITCPEGVTRKSLAWYYYTVESGETKGIEDHSTVYQVRPGKDSVIAFRKTKEIIRQFIPPIILSGYQRLKKTFRKR